MTSSPKSSLTRSSQTKVPSQIRRKGIETSLLLYAVSLPISMSGTNVALGLLLFFTLWNVVAEKTPVQIPSSAGFLLLFFLWAAVTACIAERRLDYATLGSFSKIWNLFPMTLIPLGAAQTPSTFRKILIVLFSAALIVAILGIFEYYEESHTAIGRILPTDLVREGRFYGFQSHPLHSGGLYCLLSLSAFSMVLFDRSGNNLRIFWGACSLILALGLGITFSRSYYLALAAGAAVLLAAKGPKFLIFGALAGFIFVLGLAAIDQNFRHRISTISAAHMDESARIRTKLWKAAVLMIKDNPWTGVGYHRWRDEILAYSKRIPNWSLDQAAYAHAHNSYLTLAAETGIPGLIFFLLFWISLIREQLLLLRKVLRDDTSYPLIQASLAALGALLVAAFFEHNLMTATISLCLFFLLGLSRTHQEGTS